MSLLRLLVLASTSVGLFAQLTTEQRVHDFQELGAALSRFYAPANWKIEALGANIFNLRPWIERIRTVQSDLEYYEICMEFVTSLQDGHTAFTLESNFSASLGINIDIYDGRPLIEGISRVRYPVAQFPFQIGDELVSIDGVSVDSLLTRFARLQSLGNERPTRRLASAYVTNRVQAVIPRAPEVPNESDVVIRRASTGELETYRLTWLKSGRAIDRLPAAPNPILAPEKTMNAAAAPGDPEGAIARLIELKKQRAPKRMEDAAKENALIGFAARTPYYSLPAGFVRRRGVGSDFTFSGTYESDGLRIGLIRIPTFSVTFGAAKNALLREIEGEVAFMRANTDGLVLDVSRNNGGFCSGDVAARFATRQIRLYEQQFLGSLLFTNVYENAYLQALANGAEPWVVENFRYNFEAILGAATSGQRALTGPQSACDTTELARVSAEVSEYPVRRDADGNPIGYNRPFILLADELSASEAEHFASIIQDNDLAPVVGVRTPGLGGSIVNFASGYFGEANLSLTITLTVRNREAQAPGLPASRYLETTGVIPDVTLDYMTRENLIQGGQPFVQGFTRILAERIRASR
jgi:hypothetical protein